MFTFDETVMQVLGQRLQAIEHHLEGDACFFYGEIGPILLKSFRDFIEKLHPEGSSTSRLVFFLNTPGGSVEAAEKMVDIVRHHYSEVYFVVPDFAMSAGTILCMAGDKIFMDYTSSLGPIDPQVFNGKEWVPALGYLDKVKQLIEKAQRKELTDAEFLILQSLDLAQLSRYEQARDLTVTLLKRWLVDYKFKDWVVHLSSPEKLGKAVTLEEKTQRAEEIARLLGDNTRWHSHGRMIGIEKLTQELRLKIDDYSRDPQLRSLVRAYNDLLIEYIRRSNYPYFLHSKTFF